MSYSAALEIIDYASDKPPERYWFANRIFGHALLVAEAVGVSIEKAVQALDAVALRDEPSFTTTEIGDLRMLLEATSRALDLAITPTGLPTDTDSGQALAKSEYVTTDEQGVLMMALPQMPMTALQQEIAKVAKLLDGALAPSAELRYVQT